MVLLAGLAAVVEPPVLQDVMVPLQAKVQVEMQARMQAKVQAAVQVVLQAKVARVEVVVLMEMSRIAC
jgi:hypothetical protein